MTQEVDQSLPVPLRHPQGVREGSVSAGRSNTADPWWARHSFPGFLPNGAMIFTSLIDDADHIGQGRKIR